MRKYRKDNYTVTDEDTHKYVNPREITDFLIEKAIKDNTLAEKMNKKKFSDCIKEVEKGYVFWATYLGKDRVPDELLKRIAINYFYKN